MASSARARRPDDPARGGRSGRGESSGCRPAETAAPSTRAARRAVRHARPSGSGSRRRRASRTPVPRARQTRRSCRARERRVSLPFRSPPTAVCHPPARSEAACDGTWRSSARIRAQVCTGAPSDGEPVPHTVIPEFASRPHVDRRVPHRRRGDELQPWQFLENRSRERRALAQDTDDVEGLEAGDDVGGVRVIAEGRNRGGAVQHRPVSEGQGHALIVVQYGDVHGANVARAARIGPAARALARLSGYCPPARAVEGAGAATMSFRSSLFVSSIILA